MYTTNNMTKLPFKILKTKKYWLLIYSFMHSQVTEAKETIERLIPKVW